MAQALISSHDPVDRTFSLPLLAQSGEYLQPFASAFPDQRLFRCFVQAVKGVIAAGVPIISRIAAVLHSRDPRRTFHVAKRFYRWLANPRFRHRDLLKPAYAQTRALSSRTRQNCTPASCWASPIWRSLMVTALKPFPRSNPPGCAPGLAVGGQSARLQPTGRAGPGPEECRPYLRQDHLVLHPGLCQPQWDIFRAIRYSHVILQGRQLRFIYDRGFDDKKNFTFVTDPGEEFVIRLYHNCTLRKSMACTSAGYC